MLIAENSAEKWENNWRQFHHVSGCGYNCINCCYQFRKGSPFLKLLRPHLPLTFF